jgi:HEPN domain-containing protein
MRPEKTARPDARLWITEAAEELRWAGMDREREGAAPLRCSAALRAAEKGLKALIIAHGKQYPVHHNIGALIDTVTRVGSPVPQEHREAADLTVYGGRQGYEHLEPQSNAEKKPQTTPRTTAEADEAERKAGRLVEWCRREYERIENS